MILDSRLIVGGDCSSQNDVNTSSSLGGAPGLPPADDSDKTLLEQDTPRRRDKYCIGIIAGE